jgi:hypothetical protein
MSAACEGTSFGIEPGNENLVKKFVEIPAILSAIHTRFVQGNEP